MTSSFIDFKPQTLRIKLQMFVNENLMGVCTPFLPRGYSERPETVCLENRLR